ncbi:MAG: helix-turn-helix transcriptional regulator [Deltaproteobacteria bacterium]|nr:helix-turn-helix transcriptional regulator [Deltaproteobacteria bacterium]
MTETFGEVVKRKRMELSLSQKKLGHLAGVTGTYVADMENFGKIPKDSVVLKMAVALGLDPFFFLLVALKERNSEDDEVISLYEKAFKAYSQARAWGEINGPVDEVLHPSVVAAQVEEAIKRGLKIIIADPEQIQKEPYCNLVKEIEERVHEFWTEALSSPSDLLLGPLPYRYTVPVISHVSAGEPFQWTDGGFEAGDGLEKVELPPGIDPKLAEKIYAVRVRGDSMFPYLKDGATLFVKPESREEVRHGDYVIFKDQDYNAWVKMVLFRNDQIILRSLNPDYGDMVKDEDELILLEKVISITL